MQNYRRELNRERYFATVEELVADGEEEVFDIQVPASTPLTVTA
ncbi:MAG: hypothetical protein U5J62_03710 [Desulfurivibrio sp.]|nr:hypothetical protein [Desulfurivibrio sp.]